VVQYFVKYIHILAESPPTKKRLNYKIWLLIQDITHFRKQSMPNIDKPHLVAYLSPLPLQINGLHTSTQWVHFRQQHTKNSVNGCFNFMWRCEFHMLWISSEVYRAMRKMNPVVVSVMTIYCFTSCTPTFKRNLLPAYSG